MGDTRFPLVGVTARRWLALVLLAGALLALYSGALRTGFLNDDYFFLEQARGGSVLESFREPGAIGNYFRPLARQVYYAAVTPLSAGSPLVFHAVSFALFLAAAALLLDLLLAFVPFHAALAGVAYFALLPLQRVNLTWISCSQDLLALVGALGALALFRRGRDRLSLLAFLAAALSKESALPLPALLALWAWRIDRQSPRRVLVRVAPFALPVLAWAAGTWALRGTSPTPARLHFGAADFAAGLVHLAQTLAGLEQPQGWLASLLGATPHIVAFALLALLAAWMPAERRRAAAATAAAPDASSELAPVAAAHALPFAAAWLLAFGLVTGPAVATWSAYYYTLAAVGAALLVARFARRIGRWGWIVLSAVLLWWHAGATSVRTFALADDRWSWTSHLTPYYFERGAALTASLRTKLREAEPAPAHETRFFFAALPSWAGFQAGNGPLIRDLYRDRSLESFFYSQYSESTAAEHPTRFLLWDGERFERLYANAADPMFQVGTDLLLLDRPRGAAHAFRRGLASGGNLLDHAYWLGWACLWAGDRDAAETAWKAAGAADDSTMWYASLREARTGLVEGDTLRARRFLALANLCGMGRPEGHAALGELMLSRNAKYALLETKVASRLKPNDWLARRDLLVGLVAARLDEPARGERDVLERIYPEWRADSVARRAIETLEARSPRGERVARFTPERRGAGAR